LKSIAIVVVGVVVSIAAAVLSNLLLACPFYDQSAMQQPQPSLPLSMQQLHEMFVPRAEFDALARAFEAISGRLAALEAMLRSPNTRMEHTSTTATSTTAAAAVAAAHFGAGSGAVGGATGSRPTTTPMPGPTGNSLPLKQWHIAAHWSLNWLYWIGLDWFGLDWIGLDWIA
jgi:hypothetical protein